MRLEVDAIIFSAFLGEMDYYKTQIEGLSITSHPVHSDLSMQYFIGSYKGKSVVITHSGLGKIQATSSFIMAYMHFSPKITIFTGTAGAVDMSLRTGDVVLGQRCLDADLMGIHEALKSTPFESCLELRHGEGRLPKEYFADEKLLTIANREPADWKKLGCLATSDNFPSPKEKIGLLREAGVSSMDMEASAFYHTASVFKVPALAIRSISNELDTSGGDEAIGSSDIRSSDRAAAVALDVVEHSPY